MITFSKLGNYGRFGNQLWQVAATMSVAERNKTGYVLPNWFYSRYFKNELPQSSQVVSNKTRLYTEKQLGFQEINLNNKYDWDLEGYFQSWKYLTGIEDQIRYYFDFKGPFEQKKDFVSIHVRRGDYLTYSHVFVELLMDYYNRAMDYFGRDKTFMIFSDDPSWCKYHFKEGNLVFDMGSPEVLSFREMSMCEHHIIANSSFSWWAAYLNPNPDKIILAPNKWTSLATDTIDDRLPLEWKRLEV